ncbi:YfiT family bacillithiol transferase [Deinococcus cellulosilyticus]|uniref:Putative metal-dependent hydrolase DC3_36600 n=1 Tax=Deinococcus cellulosilyticus (strain DSM 18568 / NBRC 106333 / KACC 11606 / 5516J-15) TaxID=1223518 RepID=A0A511N596_DEIC1|nr:putative metal-dependent hydrolase [Deinococcus cellulosilyticus]GEM48025.1 putative metal-dependent hydrolase [Deinococcus cellulosilyticus NBRC 106333 = KACC 11606]
MDSRYPIGRFIPGETQDPIQVNRWIDAIAAAPAHYHALVTGLSDEALDLTYRDGGWTIRQVMHHVPDSHTQAYTRFKLALTEDNPTIKPYDEHAWAQLADYSLPVAPSLAMLEAVHTRWVHLLRSLTEEQFNRTFNHPESGILPLWHVVGLYAWHSEHHLAHIKMALEKAPQEDSVQP